MPGKIWQCGVKYSSVWDLLEEESKSQLFPVDWGQWLQMTGALVVLKVKYKGILFYEILMDCVARKRMQKTTSNYLKWFPRYCDLNVYMLSH